MKTETIEIVDRGRGPQLSTSRITVQDVVPYLQKNWSHNDILRCMPGLCREELLVVEYYYRQHTAELNEEDRLIRERGAALRNPLWVENIAAEARAERSAKIEKHRQERGNGEQH